MPKHHKKRGYSAGRRSQYHKRKKPNCPTNKVILSELIAERKSISDSIKYGEPMMHYRCGYCDQWHTAHANPVQSELEYEEQDSDDHDFLDTDNSSDQRDVGVHHE